MEACQSFAVQEVITLDNEKGDARMMTTRICSRVYEIGASRPVRRGRAARLAGSYFPVCKGHSLRGFRLSIVVMNAVIADRQTKGGERLLLLCMARYASDTGNRIFPSVSTLMADTQQDRRAVQRQLRSLEEKGLIVQVGTSKHSTVNYCIAVDKLNPGAVVVRSPAVPKQARGGFEARRGGSRPPDSSSNTSLNRQEPEEKPYVKTQTGIDALQAISKLLPNFKIALQKDDQ